MDFRKAIRSMGRATSPNDLAIALTTLGLFLPWFGNQRTEIRLGSLAVDLSYMVSQGFMTPLPVSALPLPTLAGLALYVSAQARWRTQALAGSLVMFYACLFALLRSGDQGGIGFGLPLALAGAVALVALEVRRMGAASTISKMGRVEVLTLFVMWAGIVFGLVFVDLGRFGIAVIGILLLSSSTSVSAIKLVLRTRGIRLLQLRT